MGEKKYGQRAWDFLGSRDLSVFIFIMGLTYVLFLAIFGIVLPVPWVTNISKLLPFKVLYFLFFINLIICEIKWIPVIVKRCREPRPPENAEDLRRFRFKINANGRHSTLSSLERGLRWRWYRVQSEVGSQCPGEENDSHSTSHISLILYAHKGRFSPVGNLLFHSAFILLLLGVFLSLFLRFEGSARVPEEYPFTGTPGEYSGIATSLIPRLPPVSFSVEKISPEFWAGKLLFTDMRAYLSYEGGRGVARMSSPLSIGASRVSINSIGITPRYVLRSKEGKELDVGDVNLSVLTPGSEDHFQIPGLPHQIFVSYYPDHEIKDGKIINHSMEPNNPAYFLRIFRGRLMVYSGLVKPGEGASFDGMSLSFPEMRYWGEFKIVSDPGFIWIWTAFVLFGAGLIWRLLFYRREVAVVKEGEAVYICGNSDYYHRLFDNGLKTLAGMADEG